MPLSSFALSCQRAMGFWGEVSLNSLSCSTKLCVLDQALRAFVTLLRAHLTLNMDNNFEQRLLLQLLDLEVDLLPKLPFHLETRVLQAMESMRGQYTATRFARRLVRPGLGVQLFWLPSIMLYVEKLQQMTEEEYESEVFHHQILFSRRKIMFNGRILAFRLGIHRHAPAA